MVWGENMLSQKNDILKLSQSLSFWEHLSLDEREMVISNTSNVSYKKGQNIHSVENDCVGTIIVKSGELRAYILSEEGKEVTLFRLGEGDICVLSASCVIKRITFDVFIDCEEEAEIFLLGVPTFQKLCNQNIYVENFSYKILSERFSDVMWAMEQILFMSLEKRMAVFLLDEAAKNGGEILLTHEQIAKYIGSAREVVSRMLKTFEKQGIVELSRGSVRVRDRLPLRRMM